MEVKKKNQSQSPWSSTDFVIETRRVDIISDSLKYQVVDIEPVKLSSSLDFTKKVSEIDTINKKNYLIAKDNNLPNYLYKILIVKENNLI